MAKKWQVIGLRGSDGKSAYEYAKDGGYTGTEEDFAKKLASEDPVQNAVTSTIDHDSNVRAVNHRGFNTVAPENTIPAYILSAQKGFRYVECDVSFTSDDIPVLLHDSTIDRTSDGSGSISAMTYAQASQYDYGSWKSAEYAGTHLPTLDEFLIRCKGLGLHPYIEIKNDSSVTRSRVEAVVAAVKAAGMKGKVTYISFNTTFLGYVKSTDPAARLGYVVDTITDTVISTATGLKLDTNEVFIDANHSKLTDSMVTLCINADLPLEVWTANDENWINEMPSYISGVTSDNQIAGKILYNTSIVYEYATGGDSSHTHSYTAVVTTAATCTTAGARTYTCDCGDSYTEEIPATGHTYADGVCSICGAKNPDYEEEVTLTGITASYDGGTVAAGTALTDLTGIVVTAQYSDGTTETVTGYTMSGTITEGENTVTVSYGGKTTTITVTGIDTTVPEWVDDTLILTAPNLMIARLSNTYEPYYKTGANETKRLCYVGFDIPVEYGYTYRFDYVSTVSNAQIGTAFYNEAALDIVASSGDITAANIYDPGWQTNGVEIEVPELINNSPIAGVRLSFRKANETDVTANMVTSVTITRTAV